MHTQSNNLCLNTHLLNAVTAAWFGLWNEFEWYNVCNAAAGHPPLVTIVFWWICWAAWTCFGLLDSFWLTDCWSDTVPGSFKAQHTTHVWLMLYDHALGTCNLRVVSTNNKLSTHTCHKKKTSWNWLEGSPYYSHTQTWCMIQTLPQHTRQTSQSKQQPWHARWWSMTSWSSPCQHPHPRFAKSTEHVRHLINNQTLIIIPHC